MEEKPLTKCKKNYNALEDKLGSQIKRIQELLKSGNIPWLRVKSAYSMIQIAIRNVSQQIVDLFPIKQYIKLSEMIIHELLENFNDQLQQQSNLRIQSKLIYPKKILNKNGCKQPISYEINSKTQDQKASIQNHNKISSIPNQSLVQNELKKVIESLNASKTSLMEQILKNKYSYLDNQFQNIKTELSEVFQQWKQQNADKHKELVRWAEQNKLIHNQAIKKKDSQIERLLNQLRQRRDQSHCGVQTAYSQKNSIDILKQKQQQFNLQKERFLRVTKGYQRQNFQLKKYNKSLRTSAHLKIQEYQKNISQFTQKLQFVKSQFKEYFEENRFIQSMLFDVVQKHQKAKTPFIPKSQIMEVYDMFKKNAKKQECISSILIQQQQQQNYVPRKVTRGQELVRNKNSNIMFNSNGTPKINSFHVSSKLRKSIRSSVIKNTLHSSLKQDSLPFIKTNQFNQTPRALISSNSKSMYSGSKYQTNQNCFSILEDGPDREESSQRILSRKIFFDEKNQGTLLQPSSTNNNKFRIPSKTNPQKQLRSIIKQSSRQNINSSQTISVSKGKNKSPVSNPHKRYISQNNETKRQQRQVKYQKLSDYEHIKFQTLQSDTDQIFTQQPEQSQQNHQNGLRKIHDQKEKEKIQSESEQQINYIINISNVDQKQQNHSKKRTSINLDQKYLNKTTLNISKISGVNSNISSIKNQKQNLAPKAYRSFYTKQQKTNTKTFQNKQIVKRQWSNKKVELSNTSYNINTLQKQIRRSRLSLQYCSSQITQSIKKLKRLHKSICPKATCQHLKKFEERLKKIMKNQQSNKKTMKLAQLNITHEK